ncbi:ALK and LTK ligand 1 isoform X2 [Bombina bombina]|uniref:ALK and LTK ligand 1 isoform X2 n=1 Tax=Bombina bombina TaxID=8345 RepID=UPI00235AD8A0|nr:ALK and LTK ligand 1 isoform X2 [Bombina bombina]
MQGERKWHALLAISLLLITSSAHGNREVREKERATLLDVIVRAIGDSNNNREKVISRRHTEGAEYSADQNNQRLSSRERTTFVTKPSSKRPIEIFSRDPNLKDKFIQHFTGPVTFSAECNKHFHRLYHNTRECSTPIYYKRCARLLTRLAMSPLCSQS